MKIDNFKGEYEFLSNFWPAEVIYYGNTYPSVEHAYQAAKSLDTEVHSKIRNAKTAAAAKKMGKTVELRKDWENIKLGIMQGLLRQKFSKPELKELLLATGDAELVEGNWWGDTFWGVCRGRGENHLGKILMNLRMNLSAVRPDSVLLANLKTKLLELEELLAKVSGEWNYEDMVYRFYHQSFKVYYIQGHTEDIVNRLKELMPNVSFNKWFSQIISDGTNKHFEMDHNKEWLTHTRPMLEAFFHAKYFLEMAVKYGKELQEAPNMLPSGWAAFLYLYNMR